MQNFAYNAYSCHCERDASCPMTCNGCLSCTQTMSLYGVEVMQSWTDSRLAAVTHDLVDLRLYGDQVDRVWTPDLHVINQAPRRPLMDTTGHRVLAISTAGLLILHQRYML